MLGQVPVFRGTSVCSCSQMRQPEVLRLEVYLDRSIKTLLLSLRLLYSSRGVEEAQHNKGGLSYSFKWCSPLYFTLMCSPGCGLRAQAAAQGRFPGQDLYPTEVFSVLRQLSRRISVLEHRAGYDWLHQNPREVGITFECTSCFTEASSMKKG